MIKNLRSLLGRKSSDNSDTLYQCYAPYNLENSNTEWTRGETFHLSECRDFSAYSDDQLQAFLTAGKSEDEIAEDQALFECIQDFANAYGEEALSDARLLLWEPKEAKQG